jgi:predicted XRE-type DNA-binding protein
MPKTPEVASLLDVVAELAAIKRLLVLQLLRSEATQDEIAKALRVDQSVVSRMMRAGQQTRSIRRRR